MSELTKEQIAEKAAKGKASMKKDNGVTLRYVCKGTVRRGNDIWLNGNVRRVSKAEASYLLSKFPKRFKEIKKSKK